MSVILNSLKFGVLLLVLYYIGDKILKWFRLRSQLSWMSGPMTLPIIGNAHQLIGKKTTDIPGIFHKWNKKFGSCYTYWVGMEPVITVQDPHVNQVLSNAAKQAEKSIEYSFIAAYIGDSLLTTSGDVWFRKRRLITPCFHYEILDSFLETMNKHAKNLVHYLDRYEKSGQTFEFFSIAKLSTLDILMETSMGSSANALENENDPYCQAVKEMRVRVMTRSLSVLYRSDFIFNLSEKKKEETRIATVLKNYVRKIIDSRRETRKNSKSGQPKIEKGKKKQALLDMMLDLIDSGTHIDDQEIENEVNTFIFAGHDTAAVGISYLVYLMAKHPQIQERVYKELIETAPDFQNTGLTQNDINKLEYMDRCVKESMRMFPSVPLIGKNLSQPIMTDKGLLPAGVNITQNIYNVHHNEEYYPNPEVFDPDRFLPDNSANRNPYTYLPFGSGSRNCIGQRFAVNELKTLLSYFLINYKITTQQDYHDLKLGFDLVLTPYNGININIKRRSNT